MQEPIMKKPPPASIAKPPVQANQPKSPAVRANQPKLPVKATPVPGKQPVRRREVFPHYLNQQKQPKRKHCCRFICCFLFVCFLVFVLCVAIAGGLFYLWFAPKLPVFKLRPVHFTRFGLKTEPDGTCYLDSGVNVWLEVKNPNNKMEVYYGGAQVTVSADVDVELGSAHQTGFKQASRNVTVLRLVTRTGVNESVDLETGKRLNATVKSEEVKVIVEVKTKVGFGVGQFKVGMMPVDVACGGVSLKKLKEDGPPKCLIKWFTW